MVNLNWCSSAGKAISRSGHNGVSVPQKRWNWQVPTTERWQEEQARAVHNARPQASAPGGCLFAFFKGFVILGLLGLTLEMFRNRPGTAVALGIMVIGFWSWRRSKRARRHAALLAEAARQEDEARRSAAEAQQLRWNGLAGRYGEGAAARIWKGEFWVGQTSEMLVSSIGPPLERDERISKSKTCHVYKYRPLPGSNRWGLRIELENGVVTGWEAKDV
jgi:hypothetical protein